jgi:ABC-type nickel/cobalt efflux system permease component RcnA
MIPALAGMFAGMMHVVSGPDHLVAVAPLAIKKPALGLRVGTAWGLGHATGVIVLGLLGVAARSFIDMGRISVWSEVLVGFVLIGIGAWALWQSRKLVLHRHPHVHSHQHSVSLTRAHEHLHVHAAHEPHTVAAHIHHQRSAYAVGILHGAAGTGHLLGVMPALALTPHQGLIYLLTYGIAAVLSMAAFGALMGKAGHRMSPRLLCRAMQSLGGVAVAIGIYWVAVGWPLST